MSAALEPRWPNADALRIRSEIERLSQEQNKALEIAMHVGMSPTEQNQYDHRHQQIVHLLKQLAALDAGVVSKLSAQMVELSLQEAHRDPTLLPKEQDFVSSPSASSSTDVQSIARPLFENAIGTESIEIKALAQPSLNHQQVHATAGARTVEDVYSGTIVRLQEIRNYWSRSTAIRNLRGYWKSAQINPWFFISAGRILGSSTRAAERSVIRQCIQSLMRHLSTRAARAAQFVAEQISASKAYRCRDCGRELGFRSRPRSFIECYILPLLLIRPVRCAACFRRDYRLIFTTVHKGSHREDETVAHMPRPAA